jgi:hypothetical protein
MRHQEYEVGLLTIQLQYFVTYCLVQGLALMDVLRLILMSCIQGSDYNIASG